MAGICRLEVLLWISHPSLSLSLYLFLSIFFLALLQELLKRFGSFRSWASGATTVTKPPSVFTYMLLKHSEMCKPEPEDLRAYRSVLQLLLGLVTLTQRRL